LAFEWLRANVRAFGGDPARIVGVGYSAGGASLATALVAYAHDPIVQAAVLMSGTAPLAGGSSDSREFRRVAANAGCSSPLGDSTSTAAAAAATTATATTAATSSAAHASGGNNATPTVGRSEDDLARDRRELECMKRVDARQLMRAISNETTNVFGAPRGGYPRYDDVILFTPQELTRRMQEGRFARVVRSPPIVFRHGFRRLVCYCMYTHLVGTVSFPT
jgi:carboxylesterase type B